MGRPCREQPSTRSYRRASAQKGRHIFPLRRRKGSPSLQMRPRSFHHRKQAPWTARILRFYRSEADLHSYISNGRTNPCGVDTGFTATQIADGEDVCHRGVQCIDQRDPDILHGRETNGRVFCQRCVSRSSLGEALANSSGLLPYKSCSLALIRAHECLNLGPL
jgi:hypothetical protein